jgi:anti-sigma factor RsiW
MKENRFIELLNLYVDQQLTAAEATELEAEIQRDPARRRTYNQYCRMQKACTQLFEQQCQDAPSSSELARALAQAERKVVAFPERNTQWRQRGIFAVGVATMAACVAFVLVRQTPVAPTAQPIAVTTPAVTEPVATATAVVVAEPVPAAEQPVSVPLPDPQARASRGLYTTLLPVRQFVPVQVVTANGDAIASSEEKPDFAWMKAVELAPMRPVSAEELMADSNPSMPETSRAYINSRSAVPEMYEKAAFQFQK